LSNHEAGKSTECGSPEEDAADLASTLGAEDFHADGGEETEMASFTEEGHSYDTDVDVSIIPSLIDRLAGEQLHDHDNSVDLLESKVVHSGGPDESG